MEGGYGNEEGEEEYGEEAEEEAEEQGEEQPDEQSEDEQQEPQPQLTSEELEKHLHRDEDSDELKENAQFGSVQEPAQAKANFAQKSNSENFLLDNISRDQHEPLVMETANFSRKKETSVKLGEGFANLTAEEKAPHSTFGESMFVKAEGARILSEKTKEKLNDQSWKVRLKAHILGALFGN